MEGRYRKLLLSLLVLVLVVSIGKESYALFTSSVSSTVQNYGTGTLKLSYSNSVVSLNNAYPMSDSDGMNMGSGIITITNTGTLAYKFDVKIDVSSSSTLSNDLIKVSIDEQNPAFLSTDGNVIIRDIILNPGSSRSFSLKLWIDSSATSSQVLGKKFVGNLTSTGIAVRNVDDSVGTVLVGGYTGPIYDYIKNNADTTTTIDFSKTSVQDNTNGIYMTTNTDSGNPVYYYRGNVDNRVIFANFCWRIVRTTETGGVKLIYDGVPTANTSSYNAIDRSKYTVSNDTTWPFVYDSKNKTWKSKILEGEVDIYSEYSGFEAGSYQLEISVHNDSGEDEAGVLLDGSSVWTNASTSSGTVNLDLTSSSVVRVYHTKWSMSTDGSDYIEFTFKKAASSCNNTGSNSTIGSSKFNESSANAKYVGYKYGSSIDDETYTDESTIKKTIDTWYEANMRSYTSQLEDTVFCNDRSYTTSGSTLFFGAYTRLITHKTPTLKCQNTKDKFTINTSNGNGALTYPVGLITADEMAYAGGVYNASNSSFYLYTGQQYWALSPFYFFGSYALKFTLNSHGNLLNNSVNYSIGVRPSVSLQPGIAITGGGSGTAAEPFVIG